MARHGLEGATPAKYQEVETVQLATASKEAGRDRGRHEEAKRSNSFRGDGREGVKKEGGK